MLIKQESIPAKTCRALWLLLIFAAMTQVAGAQFRPTATTPAHALATIVAGTHSGGSDEYQLYDLKVEKLPPLHIARSGHTTFYTPEGPVVLGGHTDGFVPTPSAEFFANGKWHLVPLVYCHDNATALMLRSGKIFLAGGHAENFGIGQTFSAEIYDPATHSSRGFGCMDRKRAYANAIEMADGEVVIAGNWYEEDGIEKFANVYDSTTVNAKAVKPVDQQRVHPHIMRISDDDAIIFSSIGNRNEQLLTGVVDRLKGPAYHEPFLDKWHPIRTANIERSTNQFIGNEAEHRYEWLFLVEDDEKLQVAIAKVTGPTEDCDTATFSLLPTSQPLPVSIRGKKITYSSLIADRKNKLVYLIGHNDEHRIFVMVLSYESPDTSPLAIYVTEPQPIVANNASPVLTPDGDLIFAGGSALNNFTPSDAAIKLLLAEAAGTLSVDAVVATYSEQRNRWLWVLVACLIVCSIAGAHLAIRKKAKPAKAPADQPIADSISETEADKNAQKDEMLADLFKGIEQLMADEQPYLNPNLRASDVAVRVGSNTAYVSAAINSQRGCSFSQYLTSYRIAYAQKLMRQNPEEKIATISTLSGFSTDSTFFRAFRSITGMSPKEWMSGVDTDGE